jgi:hypothetical protein
MEPIFPPTSEINFPGFTMMGFRVKTALSNVINDLIVGNQRATYRPTILASVHSFMLQRASGTVASLLRPTIPEVKDAAPDPKRNALDLLLRDLETGHLGDLLTALRGQKEHVPNLGRQLEVDFKAAGLIAPTNVAMPAFGYARPHNAFVAGLPLWTGLGYRVPSPNSEFSMKIALLLTIIDTTRFNINLIPAPKKTGIHDPKEMIGKLISTSDTIKAAVATYIAYLWQAPTFIARLNARLWRSQQDKAKSIAPHADKAISDIGDDLAYVETLPLHGLLTYIVDVATKAKTKDYYGTHDCHLYDMDSSPKPPTGREDGLPDFVRAAMTSAVEGIFIDDDAYDTVWGTWGSKGGESEQLMTLPRLVRSLKSLGDIVDLAKGQVAKLGWHAMHGEFGEVSQGAADFIVCDGRGYSSPVGAAVLGVRPVISAGNVKLLGLGRRFEEAFNVDNKILYSTMVVRGHTGTFADGQTYARHYMPDGMTMGEGDCEVMVAREASRDPVLSKVVQYWVNHSSQYIAGRYGVPGGDLGTQGKLTDWDAYAVDDSASLAQGRLITMYNTFAMPANKIPYAISRDGFSYRLPMQVDRSNAIYFFDEYGAFVEELPYDGNLVYNDVLNLKYSDAELQALVDSIIIIRDGSVDAEVV